MHKLNLKYHLLIEKKLWINMTASTIIYKIINFQVKIFIELNIMKKNSMSLYNLVKTK